jgi:integrase
MAVPKYRKHSSRDKAFVELNGKRHYLPGSYNSHESRNAYRKFIHDLHGPIVTRAVTARMSIAGLVEAYMDHASTYYPRSHHHKRGEYYNIHAALIPFADKHGKEAVEDWTPSHLSAYQDFLAKKKLSRNYVNTQIKKIKRAFKWAVIKGYASERALAILAVESLKAGRSEARETEDKTPVEKRHFDPVVKIAKPPIKQMMLIQYYTGVRSDSLCQLKPNQVKKTKDGLTWFPVHKTRHLGKSLAVPIGPRCKAILDYVLYGAKDDEYVFTPIGGRTVGERYIASSYRTAVRRLIDKVNEGRKPKDKIPYWSPHQLRHSKGTSVRDRYGVEAAQAVLGHDSLKSTEIYSERRLKLARQVARETG